MGGRGSCYLNFSNSSNSSAGIDLLSLSANLLDDEDTKKEYNGKTEKLKNKNIHIKESTDKLPEDVFIPNIRKVDQLTRKYLDSTEILKTTQNELAVRSDKLKSNTMACFVSNTNNLNSLQLVLNKDLKFSNKDRVEQNTKEMIDSGFWAKCDKKEFVNHTITHEFGHYVQRLLLHEHQKTVNGKEEYNNYLTKLVKCRTQTEKENLANKYAEEFATKCFKDIQRIHRKEFGKESKKDISEYGQTNNRETFAELFTNLNNSKEPNSLAKAMGIYLDKNMNVKNYKKFDKEK